MLLAADATIRLIPTSQAPLFLPLFSLLPSYRSFPMATNVVYICTDLLSASALMQIAETGEAVSSRHFTSTRRATRWSSVAIGAACVWHMQYQKL